MSDDPNLTLFALGLGAVWLAVVLGFILLPRNRK